IAPAPRVVLALPDAFAIADVVGASIDVAVVAAAAALRVHRRRAGRHGDAGSSDDERSHEPLSLQHVIPFSSSRPDLVVRRCLLTPLVQAAYQARQDYLFGILRNLDERVLATGRRVGSGTVRPVQRRESGGVSWRTKGRTVSDHGGVTYI